MKKLPNGIAVIDGDTHISAWVQEHNTLEIARDMLLPFKQYIPENGTVIDVGASIGDHTITYAEWVGPTGLVAAFEVNPRAYECLQHNTKDLPQVLPIKTGLSDVDGKVVLVELDNSGATYLSNGKSKTKVPVTTLDSYEFKNVNFIKIDVEGYEVKVLEGSRKTIEESRPVMLVEVNRAALERAGTSAERLFEVLAELGYSMEITDSRIPWSDPQYDIICLPIEKAY